MAKSKGGLFAEMRPGSPGQGAVAVTPSDTTAYDPPIVPYIGTAAGDLKATGMDGIDFTVPVQLGLYPVYVTKIFATGTTATGISGCRQ